MRTSLFAVVVLAMMSSTVASSPMSASDVCSPTTSQFTGYYDGCNQTPVYNGEFGWDCTGNQYSVGTLSGHWKVVMKATCGRSPGPGQPVMCDLEGDYTYKYYELCSGQWVQRTQSQFDAGDCQCS